MKEYLKIILIVFITDLLMTNFFFKNTEFWENDKWKKKYYRIKSDIYHHDLMPNVEVYETWGGKLKRKIITNSLGFRDIGKNKVLKNSDKTRVLLIGDSFIEVILNQDLGEPFRRDAMTKPVQVAGLNTGDMKPHKSLNG